MKELDKIDFRILKILQKNARIPMTELAEKVGLSTTPVTERVRRLEREHYISGYHAHLNPPSVGQTTIGFCRAEAASQIGQYFRRFQKRSAENSANYGMPLGVGRIRLSD